MNLAQSYMQQGRLQDAPARCQLPHTLVLLPVKVLGLIPLDTTRRGVLEERALRVRVAHHHPLSAALPTLRRRQELLVEAGFRIYKEKDVRDLVHYFVAAKPLEGELQQLTFDFGL